MTQQQLIRDIKEIQRVLRRKMDETKLKRLFQLIELLRIPKDPK